MTVSDARRLKVSEQAREPWGEETAEVLMELVVPAGRDMAPPRPTLMPPSGPRRLAWTDSRRRSTSSARC
jgi:hypothetical protein